MRGMRVKQNTGAHLSLLLWRLALIRSQPTQVCLLTLLCSCNDLPRPSKTRLISAMCSGLSSGFSLCGSDCAASDTPLFFPHLLGFCRQKLLDMSPGTPHSICPNLNQSPLPSTFPISLLFFHPISINDVTPVFFDPSCLLNPI